MNKKTFCKVFQKGRKNAGKSWSATEYRSFKQWSSENIVSCGQAAKAIRTEKMQTQDVPQNI